MSAAGAAPKNLSYIEMVSAAIKELKERKGSSRQAISKYIVKEYKLDADKAKKQLNRALKRGVEKKVLVQVKGNGASGSFKNNEVPKKAIKAKKPVVKKPVVKKPKSKDVKAKTKKPASKTKKVTKSPKKAAAKKTPTKKTKKPAVKKPSAKKSASKKPAAKKASAKKATKAAK